MHIKIDGVTYTKIEASSYKASIKNVYSQAKRVKSSALTMVKVLLGGVYDISVTIMGLNKDTASTLQQSILKPAFDVEFYDTKTKTYVTASFYCQDTDLPIKRSYNGDGQIIYDPVTLQMTANQSV